MTGDPQEHVRRVLKTSKRIQNSPCLNLEQCRSLRMSAGFSLNIQATTHIGIVKVNVCLQLRVVYPRWEIDRHYPFRLEDIPPETRDEARKSRGKETLVA